VIEKKEQIQEQNKNLAQKLEDQNQAKGAEIQPLKNTIEIDLNKMVVKKTRMQRQQANATVKYGMPLRTEATPPQQFRVHSDLRQSFDPA
jgi:hypothetical protein